METSCLRCKKKNPKNLNPKIFKTRNGRMIMQSTCVKCVKFKKSRFVKEQKAEGLLSNLGIIILLTKISLLNMLLSV